MERSEPNFIPEWLKSNRSGSGSTKTQPKAQPFANSDDCNGSNSNNVSSTRPNGSDIGHSSASDSTTSTYFRRSSSCNDYYNSLSSGNYDRINQDKEWVKNKHNSTHKDNGFSNSRHEHLFPSGNRFDKDLRRAYSTLNAKQGETWKGYKSSFQRNFPSSGAENREGTSQMKRVSSPDLGNLITSLPSDRWTSALVLSPQQASCNGGGPSEADSLIASPCLSNSSSPQLPTESRKGEEQTVKQSKQLVPMTSSMPKDLVHNASEKLKPKVGQQIWISSHLQSNNLSRGGLAKLPSPTTASRSAPLLAGAKHKPTQVLERRPSAQAKSRNDFFNLMRKKSLETPRSALSPSNLDNDVDASLLVDNKGDGSFSESCELKEIENEGEYAYVTEKSVNECSRFKAFSYSEEKEVAFLNSLGWERTEGEDEGGLTREEISAFYKDLSEQIKSKPFSKSLQRMQLKFSRLLDNHTGVVSASS